MKIDELIVPQTSFRNAALSIFSNPDYNISTFYLPNATTIPFNMFGGNSTATTFNMTSATTITDRGMQNLTGMTELHLPNITAINKSAFYKCTNFESLYIEQSEQLCSLLNSNAFNSTKITSSTGSIYVPANFVDQYKEASNWSYFSNRIFALN